jgi:hypothetical protein
MTGKASRLARNGHDWHALIEFCGLVGTILIDEHGIYDAHPFASSVRDVHFHLVTPSQCRAIVSAERCRVR